MSPPSRLTTMTAASAAAFRRLAAEGGHLAAADLESAEQHAQRESIGLVDATVALGFLSDVDAYQLLARAVAGEFVALDATPPSELAIRLVPEKLARRHRIVPLRVDNRTLTYATCSPLDPEVDTDLGFAAGRRTSAVVATRSDILAALEHCYPKVRDLDRIADRLRSEPVLVEAKAAPEASESTMVDLCNKIITRAVDEGASDVHIECTKDGATVRYRICGVLEQVLSLPAAASQRVRNRFKVMSRADIAMKNRPQDGAFRVTVNNRSIDVRFSSLPTLDGEKLLMRVTDGESPLRNIDNLGYDDVTATRLKRSLSRPEGLVLVTGPTGSGKTTALYAALQHLQTGHNNIVTVEDPVERMIPGLSQIQVNVKAGNTFVNALRALLRQDPNVIMVGQVRDGEVAQIVGQAASTGHLVLTSMNTTDAATAVTRLMNLGLEPFKTAESLTAVLAQRLLRRLCRTCRRPNSAQPGTYRAGNGCEQCRQTGYDGRLPIAELLVPSEELRATIARGATTQEIRNAMRTAGCPTMREQALALVARGDTSIAEVDRVLADDAEQAAGSTAVPSPERALEAQSAAPAPIAVSSPAPLRVLVADDEPITRMLVKLLLERENYRVLEAANGSDAVEIGLRERPDLALMDLNMPGLDGYEAIQRLRSAGGAAASMPIVVLTAEEGADVQQRVLQLGADDYIQKPFDAATLVSRVNAAFSRIRMHAA